MSKITANNFGKILKKLRLQKGLSQSKLAEKADICTKYYGLLERQQCDWKHQALENILVALDAQIIIVSNKNKNL